LPLVVKNILRLCLRAEVCLCSFYFVKCEFVVNNLTVVVCMCTIAILEILAKGCYNKETMLDRSELKKIAQARIEDGEVLLSSHRYDGAVYLCGYAVEIALKERICRTLSWPGYPSTRREFANYQSFRTHNLGVLRRAYPNNRVVMRPSEKFEAKAAGQKCSEAWFSPR